MGKTNKKKIEEESEEEEAGDVFEVEKILDKRVQHGRIQYNIRWKGFSADYDTWEDEANVVGCPELVREFESSRIKEKKKNRKRKNVIIDEDPTEEISSSLSSILSSPQPQPPPPLQLTNHSPASSELAITTNTFLISNCTSTSNKTKISIENEEIIKNDHARYGVPYVEGIGFENGDCVDEIVGCKPFGENNLLYFFIRWRGKEKLSWVSNESIKQKEPLQLIEFYESRLKFGYKGEEN
ncbi:chromo domain-containing protein [Dictyostelium discoideum AX4]|uniref:Chromo domain-containing protein n=1 Tax=Dictyostelium discoideum TaxID=44689 RepID=Q55C69_DICDI|nr:chromo domain-containing protein [Dictyostelium discoideum AX4]EAL72449.1 chromo domain-containing protein [Dictyostelium discoideum AX4]|eukprot:XP_646612.1 chromo domain-containing protein [Dictyostelium discoideum AX4]